MNITIEIKNNFGNEAIYPVCEKANIFTDLLKQKTLTRNDLSKIKSLGFEIVVKQADLKI